MQDLPLLEEYFSKFVKNLHLLPAESIVQVNLDLLQQFNLLNHFKSTSYDPSLTRYFQVLETKDKITLANENFVVWIVPEKLEHTSQTYTLISINLPDGPVLELVFFASGVFNTSKLILRILEKFLREIEENEMVLLKYKSS